MPIDLAVFYSHLVSDDMTVSVPMPLDEDDFLRRRCQTCEREFKWHHSDTGQGSPEPDGGYHCPYCNTQGDDWFTEAQREWAINQAGNAVGEKLFGNFGSSSSLKVNWEPSHVPEPIEPNDMQRVDFDCHPEEPVKVLDGWTRPVHCIVCGSAAKSD